MELAEDDDVVQAYTARRTDTRRERIAARRGLAAERGEAWGRPSRFTPAQRAAVLERAARGESVRAIAQALKAPRSTVGRVIAASRNSPLARAD